MKQHNSPRTLRRAAERKARKEAQKAQKQAGKQQAAQEQATIQNSADTHPICWAFPESKSAEAPTQSPKAKERAALHSLLSGVSTPRPHSAVPAQAVEFIATFGETKTFAANACMNSDGPPDLTSSENNLHHNHHDPPDDHDDDDCDGDDGDSTISEARLNANRANAQHSTGPRTFQGRAISSKNRFVHGLIMDTEFRLLPTEDPDTYAVHRQLFHEEHQPQTPMEALIVERMCQHNWLNERALKLQTKSFDPDTGDIADVKKFALLERYAKSHENAMHKCLTVLSKLRRESEYLERGFKQKKNEACTREIKQEVSRIHSKYRALGNWTGYVEEMHELRDRLAAKYNPPPENF